MAAEYSRRKGEVSSAHLRIADHPALPLKVDDVMKFSDDPAAEGRLRTEREKLALRNMQFFFGRGEGEVSHRGST